jgi:hypothetical protein
LSARPRKTRDVSEELGSSDATASYMKDREGRKMDELFPIRTEPIMCVQYLAVRDFVYALDISIWSISEWIGQSGSRGA